VLANSHEKDADFKEIPIARASQTRKIVGEQMSPGLKHPGHVVQQTSDKLMMQEVTVVGRRRGV